MRLPRPSDGDDVMIKTAIVDDDRDAINCISAYLKRFSEETGCEITGTAFGDAIGFLEQSHLFDLVFLDIEMPFLNGMSAAEKLRETNDGIALIFVTNTAKYAVKGYSVDAVDYLLKPVSYPRFSALMKKTVRMLGSNADSDITLRTTGGMRRVPLSSVIYVEIREHLLVWHTENGNAETWGTLKEAEKTLPIERFARCNHSCIVGLRHVESACGSETVLSDGSRLAISRSKKKSFMDSLRAWGGGNR